MCRDNRPSTLRNKIQKMMHKALYRWKKSTRGESREHGKRPVEKIEKHPRVRRIRYKLQIIFGILKENTLLE